MASTMVGIHGWHPPWIGARAHILTDTHRCAHVQIRVSACYDLCAPFCPRTRRSQRALMAEVAHSYSDMIIFTNDSPRREPPENIVQDMVAGLPDTILQRYSGYVYFPFQDQGHVPLWFEPYLQKAQRTTQR